MLNERFDSGERAQEGIYLDYYHFHEAPFAITPDPGFLFLSRTHQSVIEKLLYGIHNRSGFVLLTGEVGTGKTTICRSILDSLDGKAETVYIINPSLSGIEILSTILDDLGVAYSDGAGKKELMDRLNAFLLSAERLKPVVIIIDDAQTMPMEALESLRLLSNLETDKEKLLQMVLVGQPELMDTISKPEMRQLRQRVAVNCTLDYLKREEVAGYIGRRLFVAGNKGQVRFAGAAVDKIFRASAGTPRLINRICDYSLIAGYLANDYTIQKRYVIQAIKELGSLEPAGTKAAAGSPFPRTALAVILMAVAIFTLSWSFWVYWNKDATGNTPAAGMQASAPGFKVPSEEPLKEPSIEPPKDETINSAPAPAQNNLPPSTVAVVTPAMINETAVPATKQEKETGEREGPAPSFTVLMCSHRSLSQAIQAVSQYRATGVFSNWVKVDLGEDGIWYRIFAGRFESRAGTLEFIREHGLANARILAAPWAIRVGEGLSPEALGRTEELLKKNQYDGYVQEMKNRGYLLLIGAFVTREGAEHAAREIAIPGITPAVVMR